MRILVVDDNPDALRTLGALLTMEQHTVTLAGTAGTAIDAAQQRPYDVAILDIKMPGVDGFELAGRIRAMNLEKQPALIAVSGFSSVDQAKLLKHGINVYLSKPFSFDKLMDALKTLKPRP